MELQVAPPLAAIAFWGGSGAGGSTKALVVECARIMTHCP